MTIKTATAALASLGAAVALTLASGSTAQANGFPQVNSLAVTAVATNTATIAWTGTDYGGSNRYRIFWHERQDPARSWASSGTDYGIGSSPLKLTGLLPGHVYDIDVAARDSSGWFGSSAHAVAVTSGTTTAKLSTTCAVDSIPTTTNATLTRSGTSLLVTGSVSFLSAGSWKPEPTSDYSLTLQMLAGSTWTPVTSLAPKRTTTVTAPSGAYRLAFNGACSMPYASSVSSTVTR